MMRPTKEILPSSFMILENEKAAPGKFVDLITTLSKVLSNFDATELTTPWKFTLLVNEKDTGLPTCDSNKADRSLMWQLIFSGKF